MEFVRAMWSRRVVTVMHLDTDWGKNLAYFRRDLPKGSYVLQLDSTTDIFAAKELLRYLAGEKAPADPDEGRVRRWLP